MYLYSTCDDFVYGDFVYGDFVYGDFVYADGDFVWYCYYFGLVYGV